ncbi:hypothetical protein LTR09_005386 [Extremus antarcticus]|uniref:Uncharacterized protein n=1 Tax=Extremus antarcticus TaxID=702011 RepID=A0AAJ0DN47_9PEZI|nr:hypothetical protein LTR09_005386 [Extremus antarcticus]
MARASEGQQAESQASIAAADSTSQHCHLLALPAELRNQCYTFALSHDKDILVCRRGSSIAFHFVVIGLPKCAATDLLLANRQIRREARPIFYQIYEFICAGPITAYNFLTHMKTQNMLSSLTQLKLFGLELDDLGSTEVHQRYQTYYKQCVQDLVIRYSKDGIRKDAIKLSIRTSHTLSDSNYGFHHPVLVTLDELNDYVLVEHDRKTAPSKSVEESGQPSEEQDTG